MAIIHEAPRRYNTALKVNRLEGADLESYRAVEEFQSGMSSGEPISLGQDGHMRKEVVESASRRDIKLREEEQIDRVLRKLEIGARLSRVERIYLLHVGPKLGSSTD